MLQAQASTTSPTSTRSISKALRGTIFYLIIPLDGELLAVTLCCVILHQDKEAGDDPEMEDVLRACCS